MTPCLHANGLPSRTGLLLIALLVIVGCTTTESVDDAAGAPSAEATAGPEQRAAAAASLAAFATYRAGVSQGDADAVVDNITAGSLAQQQRIADLARTADEAATRALPAAEQLLVLTYRLRPQLLDADEPYRALVDAGLAGQDRSLGELGMVELVAEDLAVGQVIPNGSTTPSPLRWRFRLEDGTWRFDLSEAQRLVSQAIGNAASRAGQGVDDLVAATISDLSGESTEVVDALYRVAAPG